MNAGKKKILFLWLPLAASLAHASAFTPSSWEIRTREKSAAPEARQTDRLQTAGRHQESGSVAYGVALDPPLAAEGRSYFYDAGWNLNRRTNNGVTSSFFVNVRNQVTNAPSPVGGVIYDLNGNTRTNHGGQWLYFYDAENRLSQFYRYDTVNPKETQFVYDGLGRLRKRLEWHFEQDSGSGPQGTAPSGSVQTDGSGTGSWVLDSETHYIYDGFRVIQERDGNDVPTVSYTRGNDLSVGLGGAGGIGGLLGRSEGYSGGDWTDHAYYYADAGGNITSMLDTNNIVVASYRYDPYGNLISSSGTLAAANVYRFSSKEFHASSGLYFYGLRFYDPNLQRWVNQDPIGEAGGINLYGFVGNGPINGVDPYGLSWLGDQMSQVFQGIYDAMMGPQPGVYNPNAKGALDADAGLVDIDRNNNALRGSMAEAGKLAGDALTEAAKNYAAGKAAGIAGAVGCRTIKGLKNLVGAAEATAAGDHIVLGLERHGLEQTATEVGGRTLLNDVNWQTTLQTAVGDPSTRFTVSLDGVSGSSAYSQFMNAAQQGVAPGASPFNWEMGQLYQAGRHLDATFVGDLGKTAIPNPFGP